MKFFILIPFSIATSEFKSTTGTKFATDNQGKVWLATEKGLCSIDKDSGFVSRYFQSNTNNKLLITTNDDIGLGSFICQEANLSSNQILWNNLSNSLLFLCRFQI